MITLHKIRDLPVSAASGLVMIGDSLHVVADDALHLGSFSLDDPGFVQQLRLRPGELPADKTRRKKMKPDFEALVLLPAQADGTPAALLALGSGSKANRRLAVRVPLDAQGLATLPVTTIDLSPLYATLPFADINIEGAVMLGEQLVLMQRGNRRHPHSALVYCPWQGVWRGRLEPRVVSYSLPCIGEVPLGFTDGLGLPDGSILFSAVAENTDDSYSDGACAGAAIGLIDAQGELVRCELLAEPHKIEGIALVSGAVPRLYAVTDADDPAVPAGLFEVVLPAEWWAHRQMPS